MIYTGCDLQIAVFLLLSLFWTTTKTPPPKRHHTTPPSPPLTTFRTPSSMGHATTLSALERVRERGRMAREERRTCGGARVFPPFFPPPSWCGPATGEGSSVAFLEETRNASKGGGGVEPKTGRSKGAELGSTKDGHAQEPTGLFSVRSGLFSVLWSL